MGFDKAGAGETGASLLISTPSGFSRIVDARSKAKGFALRDPALKRVPSGFAADHAAAELLRMKGCVATKDIGVPVDLEPALLAAFREVAPLNALLLQIAEA